MTEQRIARGDDLTRIVGWISSYLPEAVWFTRDNVGQVEREWSRDDVLALITAGRMLILRFSSGRLSASLDGERVELDTLYFMHDI
jgi:hypothetical protein